MKPKLFLLISLFPLLCEAQVVKGFKRLSNKVNITLSDGTLSISPLTENAVRIKFYKESKGNLPELILTSGVATPRFQVLDLPTKLEIKTKNIQVLLDKHTGKLSYASNAGKEFLSEEAGSRKLTPGSIQDEPCYDAEQSFESPSDEYILVWGNFRTGNIT